MSRPLVLMVLDRFDGTKATGKRRLIALTWQALPRAASVSAKLLLIGIAYHTNTRTGDCAVSMPRIARWLCCGESQARRTVHQLIDSGFITVDADTLNGGRCSRRYRINPQRLTAASEVSA